MDDGAPGLEAVAGDVDGGEASAHPVTALEDAELCSMERGGVVGEEEGGGGAGDAGAHDADVGGGAGEVERRRQKQQEEQEEEEGPEHHRSDPVEMRREE